MHPSLTRYTDMEPSACVGDKRKTDFEEDQRCVRRMLSTLPSTELQRLRVPPQRPFNGQRIEFIVLNCTYSIEYEYDGGREPIGQKTVLNVIGRGRNGQSCVVVFHKDVEQPHCYCECPDGWGHQNVHALRAWLDHLVRIRAYGKSGNVTNVTKCEIVENTRSICGVMLPGESTRTIRITVSNPRVIFTLRDTLRRLRPGKDEERTPSRWTELEIDRLTCVYNTLDYVMMARVASGIQFGQWYSFTYAHLSRRRSFENADVEVRLNSISHMRRTECSDVAGLRVLSYDCEMFDDTSRGEVNRMPKSSNKSDVIGVISACWKVGTAPPRSDNTANFVLGDVEDRETAHGVVYCFRTEQDLIQAFITWLRHGSWDAITGWNSNGFDTPYLIERAKLYSIRTNIGLTGESLKYEAKVFMSKQAGRRTNTKMSGCIGPQFIDAMVWVMANFKLASYSLDNVATEYGLGHKHAMDYSIIPVLMQTPGGRASVVKYCARDALLALQLADTMKMWIRLQAQSSFIGLDMGTCSGQTGQRTLVMAAYYKEVHQQALDAPDAPKILLPWVPFGAAETQHYEGAIVLEPKIGYYKDPVVVLDYAALYPSIMIDGRFCPSTLERGGYAVAMKKQNVLRQRGVDSEVVSVHDLDEFGTDVPKDDDVAFLIINGADPVTTMLLKKFMKWRKQYKRERDTHPVESPAWFLLEHTQLSVKIVMNSFYGCMGSNVFWDTNRIAAAITKRGRNVIMLTKLEVANLSGSYTHMGVGSFITAYGDTDSVMVQVKGTAGAVVDQEVAFDIGEDLSEKITKALFGPGSCMLLEFEKVFCNFLLAGKKRYAAKRLEGRGDKRVFKDQFKGWLRRSNVPMVESLIKSIMSCLIDTVGGTTDERIALCISMVEGTVVKLKQGVIPLPSLTGTVSINQELEKYSDSIANARFAKRLQAGGMLIVPGQRIPFVLGMRNYGDLERAHGRGSLRTQKEFVGDYLERPEVIYADPKNPLPLNVKKYIVDIRSAVRQVMVPLLKTERRVDEVFFPPAVMHVTSVQHINPRAPLLSSLMVQPRTRCIGCKTYMYSDARLCDTCASPRERRALIGTAEAKMETLRMEKLGLKIKCGQCMNQTSEPLEDEDFTCVSPSCAVRFLRMQNVSQQARTLCDIEDMCG